MKRVKLCQHVKHDGVLCGSPALKRRSYCYFHAEVRRRRKRMAQARLISGGVSELSRKAGAPVRGTGKALEIKNLDLNSFAAKTLRDTLRLKAVDSRFCEMQGGGGDDSVEGMNMAFVVSD